MIPTTIGKSQSHNFFKTSNNEMSKVTLLWSVICDWFDKRSATYSTNKLQNQSPLGPTRFPAIGTGHVHFLRVPIGSQYFGISRP